MTQLPDTPAASPLPDIGQITLHELWASLKAGLHDFRRAPQFGLFFSAIYVVGGFLMLWLGAGHVTWVLATSLGFPLYAPFAAVGLYEVSRRLESDQPLVWRDVLGVVWQERHRQIPWMGAIIVIYFLFWTFLAHMIFALFMGVSTMTNVMTSYDAFLTADGLTMIAVELAVGAAIAFLLFALTVVSLPLLLEKEIDFISAMLLSFRTVQENFFVMLVWAILIAVVSLIALAPLFLGLMVALPILGHATWHLYRRALYDPV
ncbi:DUF2189 domain-containing protein [Aestuariibius sp. HNIBRBA575]|uniref:DUF2189 domain-containing protein n=1 Tax=Aestuariibius sp. HNIBRBA575 TaxID=3233343 RepID=UPI0034A180C7